MDFSQHDSPDANDEPLGLRAVLAGYGTLVDGGDGTSDSSNKRRTGAENIIDRSVPKVSKAGVPDISLGGLLGIDFDSPSGASNSLGSGSIDNLGTGSSSSTPLDLEASTARGDSGGPAFVFTKEAWRVHGVVSLMEPMIPLMGMSLSIHDWPPIMLGFTINFRVGTMQK